MEASHSLNLTQHAVLAYAIENNNGKITWFPDKVNGGARQKVLAGLFNRALITSNGADHLVAAEGYDALGLQRPAFAWPEVTTPADPELEVAVAIVEAQWAHPDTDDNAPVCAEAQDGTDVPDAGNETNVGASLTTCAPDDTTNESQTQPEQVKVIRTRENSKQATVIQMLKRAEGASISQICEATGWQAHSVRGMFYGPTLKKLNITITSIKSESGSRVYKVTI